MVIVIVCVICTVGLLFLFLPAIGLRYLKHVLSQVRSCSITLSGVRINVFRNIITVNAVHIEYPHNSQNPTLTFEIPFVEFNLNLLKLIKGTVIGSVLVKNAVLKLDQHQQASEKELGGSINLREVLKAFKPFIIDITIENAQVCCSKMVRDGENVMIAEGISVVIKNFSNALLSGGMKTTLAGRGSLFGGSVSLIGSLKPMNETLCVDLCVGLSAVDLGIAANNTGVLSNINFANGELSMYSEFGVRDGQLLGFCCPTLHNVILVTDGGPKGAWLRRLCYRVLNRLLHSMEDDKKEISVMIPIAGTLIHPAVDYVSAIFGMTTRILRRSFPEFASHENTVGLRKGG